MQRCLVQWVSGGKKPSGHPADRGVACCPDACCSRTRNEKESFWRPWPPRILHRSSPPFPSVPCRAVSCVRSNPLPSREKSTYGGEDRQIEKVSPPSSPSINRVFNVSPGCFSALTRNSSAEDSIGKIKFFRI